MNESIDLIGGLFGHVCHLYVADSAKKNLKKVRFYFTKILLLVCVPYPVMNPKAFSCNTWSWHYLFLDHSEKDAAEGEKSIRCGTMEIS